jgi:hypothetical protein
MATLELEHPSTTLELVAYALPIFKASQQLQHALHNKRSGNWKQALVEAGY